MDEKRQSRLAPALIAAALLLPVLLLGLYVAGYFLLSERQDWFVNTRAGGAVDFTTTAPDPGAAAMIARGFDGERLKLLYKPAGAIESGVRGVNVVIFNSALNSAQ